jgi:hypothetical protein
MKYNLSKIFHITVLFLLSSFCIGCSTVPKGYRLYDGTPRPSDAVAFSLAISGANIIHITDEENTSNRAYFFDDKLELLPGSYTLHIGWSDGYNSVAKEGVDIKLKAKPGHVYVIYPEFPGTGLWYPRIVDIVSVKDYSKVKCNNCPSPEIIRDMVHNYFKGERPRKVLLGEQSHWH